MRRLGWVRRTEMDKLLGQHVGLLEEHERMIRLAQTLLKQTDPSAAQTEKPAASEAGKPAAEPIVAKSKAASKLH